jgi:hypothetical protein
MIDVGTESADLLNIEKAAELAGMSVQTFQLYVSSGQIRAEKSNGKPAMFHRESARRIGDLQRETIEAIRHQAMEQLSAELVVMRQGLEALSHRADETGNAVEAHKATLTTHEATIRSQQDGIRAISDIVGEHTSKIDSAKAQIDGLRRAFDADHGVIEKQRKAIEALHLVTDEQRKALHEQTRVVASLTTELKETRAKLDNLQDQLLKGLSHSGKLMTRSWLSSVSPSRANDEIATRITAMREAIDQALQAKEGVTTAADSLQKQATDQTRLIDAIKREQIEALRQLERLSDIVEDIKNAPPPAPAHAEEKAETPKPKKLVKKEPVVVEEPKPVEPEIEVEPIPTPTPTPPATPKPVEPDGPLPPPAKFNVLREIEFNYLMERMGYRRIDSYSPDELADTNTVLIPDDDNIRQFLARYELGCDVNEVAIASVTRGDWNMIQYQRVQGRSAKRGWKAPKR